LGKLCSNRFAGERSIFNFYGPNARRYFQHEVVLTKSALGQFLIFPDLYPRRPVTTIFTPPPMALCKNMTSSPSSVFHVQYCDGGSQKGHRRAFSGKTPPITTLAFPPGVQSRPQDSYVENVHFAVENFRFEGTNLPLDELICLAARVRACPLLRLFFGHSLFKFPDPSIKYSLSLPINSRSDFSGAARNRSRTRSPQISQLAIKPPAHPEAGSPVRPVGPRRTLCLFGPDSKAPPAWCEAPPRSVPLPLTTIKRVENPFGFLSGKT